MKQFGELYQTADWKIEKHVPVIECPDQVKSGESFEVKVTLGKEIAHPNTTEHHIRWISVYFQPEGEKFPYQVGHFDFSTRCAQPSMCYIASSRHDNTSICTNL